MCYDSSMKTGAEPKRLPLFCVEKGGIMNQLERTRNRLELYYKAEEAILTGQEYSIGTRKLRRADLADVQSMIRSLQNEVKSLETGGKNKVVRAVPLDI